MAKVITGRAFAKALEDAGIIADTSDVTRLVIDVQPESVTLHIERVGDERLINLAAILAGDA